jgi:hypothetical protein
MMKKLLLLYFLLEFNTVFSQKKVNTSDGNEYTQTGKYLSFNPLGLLEPQIAVGFGAGTRTSERSEFFTEIAYLGRNPIYKYDELNYYHGVRFLAQYRYHFLQQWRPLINLGRITEYQRERRRKGQFFVGVEFRFKPVYFSAYNAFENKITADTLNKFPYKASAQSIGGAIFFGETVTLNKKSNWLLELTIGIGARHKFVKYTNVPQGYSVIPKQPREWNFVPDIDAAVGMPYLPCTIRLRYLIR